MDNTQDYKHGIEKSAVLRGFFFFFLQIKAKLLMNWILSSTSIILKYFKQTKCLG